MWIKSHGPKYNIKKEKTKELFGKKWLTFLTKFDAILEDVSVIETIVNY